MKRMLVLAITICMLFLSFECSALELSSGSEIYPLNTQDKTITWYAQSALLPDEHYASWNESPFHTELSNRVGVTIEWSFPAAGSDARFYTGALLSDPSSLPNIMSVSWADRAAEYLDDGLIRDLTPWLADYAPAYYAFLQANPAYDKAVKTDDGRYYTFGFFHEDGGLSNTSEGLAIRADWLEACGLSMPQTTAEFEQVLRVFHEQYGAVFSAPWAIFKRSPALAGQFGGYASAVESWFVKDGKVGLGQAQDSYRRYLSWLNQLYEEGILDNDLIATDEITIKEKIVNGKTGLAYGTLEQLIYWNGLCEDAGLGEVWVACPFPKGEDGTLTAIPGGSAFTDITTVITGRTDDETLKLCLRALDYAFTQEGCQYWNERAQDDTGYAGADGGAACVRTLSAADSSAFGVPAWHQPFPEDQEKSVAAASGWQWPVMATYTLDEQDELDIIDGAISTYCSENFTKFLLGKLDVNDDGVWKKYLDKLKKYDFDEILEIRQACYDRYLAR